VHFGTLVLTYPALAPVGDSDVSELRVDEDPGLLVVLDLEREVLGNALLIVPE
jgi:hypothetical protein